MYALDVPSLEIMSMKGFLVASGGVFNIFFSVISYNHKTFKNIILQEYGFIYLGLKLCQLVNILTYLQAYSNIKVY